LYSTHISQQNTIIFAKKRHCLQYIKLNKAKFCLTPQKSVATYLTQTLFILVFTVEGVCDDVLAAGPHNIEVWVGECDDPSDQPTNFVSGGFNSPSRLHIEEIRKELRLDAGEHNSQIMTRRKHLTVLFHEGSFTNVLYSVRAKGNCVQESHWIFNKLLSVCSE